MSKIYDLNRIRKTYPLIRVKPIFSSNLSSENAIQVETAILDYNNSFENTYIFENDYDQIPVIAATPENENVNIFITSLTIDSVTIQSSSPFTGRVHVQVFDSSN